MAALGRRKSGGKSPPAAINARAVDWTPPPRDRMTCESVISAIAAGKAARLFGQKVDELGCPRGTRDGEDGGDAGRIEHDAVGLQSGCQRGIDFSDVDLPGHEIVHAYVVSIRRPGGCVVWGRAERVWLRAGGGDGGRLETHSGGCHR